MKKFIENIREFQAKLAEVEEGSLKNLFGEEYVERVNLRNRLLTEETQELENALSRRDDVEVLDAGVDSLYILLGTMHEYGLLDKFEKAWDLVHANNMTKLDENGKVVKNEYGKVVKPANYKPVDLTVLFEKKQPAKVIVVKMIGCGPCMEIEKELPNVKGLPVEQFIGYEKPEIMQKYGVKKFPTVIIVDENDEPLFTRPGFTTADKINKRIDELRGNTSVE